jgi:hypothetical protein
VGVYVAEDASQRDHASIGRSGADDVARREPKARVAVGEPRDDLIPSPRDPQDNRRLRAVELHLDVGIAHRPLRKGHTEVSRKLADARRRRTTLAGVA